MNCELHLNKKKQASQLNCNLIWIKLDSKNSYTSRYLGFSVYISNTTRKEDGKLCFKDTSYTRATIPNPTIITCTLHGRYVIYYNDRTNPPYPAGYDEYAYNELCEVEVYGEQIKKKPKHWQVVLWYFLKLRIK